jgi:hypothetical protein
VIERAPFDATGHDSSRVIFGAAALASVSKGDAERALEVLLEHGINHIDVAASYGDAELRHTAATWYEPLREQADIDLAVHWVLGRPEAFLLTTGDVEILPRLLDAAERFQRRPSEEEMAELAVRAEAAPLFV